MTITLCGYKMWFVVSTAVIMIISLKVAVASCPSYIIPENLKRSFMNVASKDQGATCTATSVDAHFLCEKAIDDDLDTEYKVSSSDNAIGTSINISFPNKHLINIVKITQLQASSAQIEQIGITFDDGEGVDEYVNLTKNAAKGEKFTFHERWISSINLTILTVHEGSTGHGYKSIEVTNSLASNDKLCNYLTLDTTNTSSHMGVYSDMAVLAIMGSEVHAILSTTTSSSSPRYVLRFGADSNTKLKLDRYGPPGVDTAGLKKASKSLSSSKWKMFSVDFKGSKIVVSAGSDILLQHDDAANHIQVKYVSFYNPGATTATILYCNREVTCYKDANHFWPLEKPTITDVITGKAEVTDIINVKSGPAADVVASAAISLKNNVLSLGDFSSKCVSNLKLCKHGITVGFWFYINPTATGEQVLLSSDTNSPGLQVNFNNDEVHCHAYDGTSKYYAKLKAKKSVWHHVTITWHSLLGMYMMVDFNSRIRASDSLESRPTDTNTMLTLGAKNDLTGSADASVSSLVIWEKALELHRVQKIGICANVFQEPPLLNSTNVYGIVPYDSIKASSDKGNTVYYSQLNFNDGTGNSAGWQPVDTHRQYIQLDLVMGRTITRIATQGGNTQSQWVTLFTMSYSLNGLQWEHYKINGSVYNFPANTDSNNIVSHAIYPSIEARMIRFMPSAWNTSINMRVGVFYNAEPFLSKGCYSRTTLDLTKPSNDVDTHEMHPGMCVTSCGFRKLTYAGVSVGNRCYCFNTLPSNDVSKYKCNQPCEGNPAFKCGSQSYVSVYEVRESLDFQFTVSMPSGVEMLTPFTATSNKQRFYADFGDDRKMSNSTAAIEYFVLGNHDRTVSSWTWIGRYGTPRARKVTNALDVYWLVLGADIVYGRRIFETGVVNVLYLSLVEGKDVTITHSSSIRKTVYSYPGPAVLDTPALDESPSFVTSGPTDVDRVYLMLDKGFKNGYLKAFSVNVASTGYLKLQVYNPVCRWPNEKAYCYAIGNCRSSVAECSGAFLNSKITCSSSSAFCITTSTCTKANMVCAQPDGGSNGTLATNYQLTYEHQVYVTEGRHVFLAKENISKYGYKLRQGNVIGITLPAGISAEVYTAKSKTRIPYQANLTLHLGSIYSTANYNDTALDYSPQVQATYIVPASYRLGITCSSVGVYADTFDFSNARNNEIKTVNYICTERIREVRWVVAPYAATYTPYNVTFPSHTGYNVTHLVEFDQETNYTQTYRRVENKVTYSHVFQSIGNHTVTVVAFNILGSKSRQCVILALHAIVDVSVDTIPPAILNDPVNVTWTVQNGTETHCNVTFGDGTEKTVQTSTINGTQNFALVHTYTAAGEHLVNITCGNLVSKVSNKTLVVVEIPVDGLACKVVHLNRDIEVNETIKFKATTTQGTNPIARYHFGDGTTNLSREFKVDKSFSYFTIFHGNITVYNNVSSKNCSLVFKVHKPVYPIKITQIFSKDANVSTPSEYMMNISSGNDFICDWDFGDGVVRRGGSNFSKLGEPVFHTFASDGCFFGKVRCINRLYTGYGTTKACVFQPITNVSLKAPLVNNINLDYQVTFGAALGTNITYNLTWTSVQTWIPVDIPFTISADTTSGSAVISKAHFPSMGVYQVTLFAINSVTPRIVKKKSVYVEISIQNFYAKSSHKYIEVNHEVNLTASVSTGSNVTFTWDFKNGTNQSRTHQADTLRLTGDHVGHSFSDHGVYDVMAIAANPLGKVSAVVTIFVQYPVKELSLTTNSPQIIPDGRTWFTVIVPDGIHVPTNATIDVKYQANGAVQGLPFGSLNISKFSKVIPTPGLYFVNVTVKNEIGSQRLNTTINVQRKIQGLRVATMHTDGDAGFGAPGRGPAYNIFPREYPIRFNAITRDGSNVTFYVTYGDGSGIYISSTQKYHTTHQYPTEGTYEIDVIANNSVSEVRYTTKIVLMDSNVNLIFGSNSPTKYNLKTELRVQLSQVGSHACCLVNLTNNTYFLYKDKPTTTCRSDWAVLSSNHKIVPSKHNISIVLSFKFWQERYYHAKTSCYNTVSYVVKYHWVIVLALPCGFPKVSIKETGRTFTNPRILQRSQSIKMHSEVSMRCYSSRASKLLWTIYKLNSTGHAREPFLNLPEGSITNRSILKLPPRALPYGTYMFLLNVSVVNLTLIDSSQVGYGMVKASPLQCFLHGGNGWHQSVYRDTVLDGHYSFDPDEPEANQTNEIEYYLYCKKTNASYTFPDDPESESRGNASSGEGCLSKPAGLVAKGQSIKTYGNNTFNGNDSLHFRLYCRKDSRMGTFDVFLEMTETDPPQCFISMDGLTLNRQVITSSKLTLNAVCRLWGRSSTALDLQWALLKKNNIREWDSNDLSKYAQSPTDRHFLVIRKDSLQHCSSYRVKIQTRFHKGPMSSTYINVDTHCSPRGGSCRVVPEEGLSSIKFQFRCENWIDYGNNSYLHFEYYYQVRPYDLPLLFVHTDQARTRDMALPEGDKAYGYHIEIKVLITDTVGATTTVLLKVKVKPDQKVSVESPCVTLLKEVQSNGELVNLEMEDNSQAINHWSLLQAKWLNKESVQRITNRKNLTTTLREMERFLAELPTQDQPITAHPKSAQVTELKSRIKTLDTKSKKCCYIRERIAASIVNTQLDSIGTIQMTSATIFALAGNPEDPCLECLVRLVGTLKQMADFFIEYSAHLSFSDVTRGMGSFFQATAGVLQGFSYVLEQASRGNMTSYEQDRHLAKFNTDVILGLLRNTMDALKCCLVPNEFPTVVFAPEVNVTLSKNTYDIMDGLCLTTGSGEITLPPDLNIYNLDGGEVNDTTRTVISEATVFLHNPFTDHEDNTSSLVHSFVTDFRISNDNGSITLQNLTSPIELWIHKKGSLKNCIKGTIKHHQTKHHKFNVLRNESSINVDVRCVSETSAMPQFGVALEKGARPSIEEDTWYNVPSFDAKNQPFHTVFYSSEESNNTMAGDYYVAVKYNGILDDQEVSSGNAELNYSICAYTSECLYWNMVLKKWTADGCKVGPRSNLTHTQCLCNHATSFASDFVVPPNSIDWDKISLDELLNNFLVAGVLLAIVGLYFLLLIPARRQDLKDLEKIGVIPIPSNDPRDMFGYELCLYTGFQAGNGTTAQVSTILSGSKDKTQPLVLRDIDGRRKLFQRGAVDSFLVTTPYDLGQLGSIKIWHNHAGGNPSWFLSRLYVRDLQTGAKTWYICNRWMAVEEDDGKIERVLHSATNKELTSFNLLFAMETRKNFSDSHLWFSVYYRPPQSTFTRVQRMTCCLCVLLSTMLANAMFYQTGGSTPNAEVKIGPFRLSAQNISIAITSSLVVLPMNLIIINIFRKARMKNPPSEDKMKRFLNKEILSEVGFDEGHQEQDEPSYKVISVDNGSEASKQSQKTEEEKNEKKNNKEKPPKQPSSLPYWSVYIAYVLAFLICAASSVFTIFYSLTFGVEKSEGWISAMMISFWQDVLVSQPIKVLVLAIIIALITKDPNKVDDDTKRSAELGHDEEWIHRDPNANERVRLQNFVPKPPGEDDLYESRQMLIKQKEMKAIIREIVVYFVYLMVLCTVAYAGQDPQAFHISRATYNMFYASSYAGSDSLESVSEPVNFWKWLHDTIIPTLKPNYWYGPHSNTIEQRIWTESNIKRKSRRGWKVKIHKRVLDTEMLESNGEDNSSLHKLPKNSIADRGTAYIIGAARLRQLRVRPGHCTVHPFFENHVYSCSATYSWENEDEGSYLSGWTSVNETVKEALQKDKKSSWIWRSAWDLQGSPYWGIFATYWGGGFVANVDPSRFHTIEEMQSLELDMWIDRYTRAIFTEFALFNAYTNLFCIVTMLSEILPTGGYDHYVQFRPIRLYRYTGPEQMVLIAFEMVYIIFLFMFTYSELKELFRRKKKYFGDPWNYLEILVIVLSFSAIGLYFARLGFGKFAVKKMKENPGEFISFTYVLLLDECQVATLGHAVFFAILKSLRLLRFNRRMSVLTITVKACAAPLLSFFFMFLVVFLAFVQFAVIVFGPFDESYSSFTTCISTMMAMTLGGFHFDSLMQANRILGAVFFLSYMIFVFIILVNVFLSIINDTLAEVKSDVELQSNDYDILDFVVHQIKAVAGVRTGPAVKPLYKKTKTQFQLDVDAIESLSENIEYALVNTIVEDQRQTNWLMVENITKKKLILLRELLRIPEDYDEDDLANLIPLMEEYLIKHSSEEVTRVVLGHRIGQLVSLRNINVSLTDNTSSNGYDSIKSNSPRLYDNPIRTTHSDDYAHFYDVPDQSSITQQSQNTSSAFDSDDESNSSNSSTDDNETLPLGELVDEKTLAPSDGKLVDEEVPLQGMFVETDNAEFSDAVALRDGELVDEETPSDGKLVDEEVPLQRMFVETDNAEFSDAVALRDGELVDEETFTEDVFLDNKTAVDAELIKDRRTLLLCGTSATTPTETASHGYRSSTPTSDHLLDEVADSIRGSLSSLNSSNISPPLTWTTTLDEDSNFEENISDLIN